MTHTYRLEHPDLSDPLEIESEVERSPRSLGAWASMWVLRNHDAVIPLGEWTVTEVTSS